MHFNFIKNYPDQKLKPDAHDAGQTNGCRPKKKNAPRWGIKSNKSLITHFINTFWNECGVDTSIRQQPNNTRTQDTWMPKYTVINTIYQAAKVYHIKENCSVSFNHIL